MLCKETGAQVQKVERVVPAKLQRAGAGGGAAGDAAGRGAGEARARGWRHRTQRP